MTLSRRNVLTTSAAGLALSAMAPAYGRRDEPWFRLSLAQWSLHRTLRGGKLDNLDFPSFTKLTFGIDAVEYVNQFFADKAGDFEYLRELKKRADDHGVRSLLIMIDGEGSLAAEEEAARRKAVENHFRWVAAAAFLGCHSIRVNAAGHGEADAMAGRAADSLVRIATLAEPYGINVIVENHGGRSSNGAWLADVMKRADHPAVGTLPDFGNFRVSKDETYDRYQGVSELMPYAKAVSAKSHDFGADGNEVNTDYAAMLKIVKDAGYRGYIGIEYEGRELDEIEGIRATQKLLERLREA